jgi:hypothetical protein
MKIMVDSCHERSLTLKSANMVAANRNQTVIHPKNFNALKMIHVGFSNSKREKMYIFSYHKICCGREDGVEKLLHSSACTQKKSQKIYSQERGL